MDLSWFPILLTFILFLLMLVKQARRRFNSQHSKLPPGPWKLPLVGNLHQLIGSSPHHAFRDMAKKHGPIMHLQLGEVPTIIISSSRLAKDVLLAHGLQFAHRPEFLVPMIILDCHNIAFAAYGPYWRQLRKICTMELLTDKRVQSFQSIRDEESLKLIQLISLSHGSPINLSEMIFSLTHNIISRAAFGKRCKDQPAFTLLIKEGLHFSGGFCMADLFPSLKIFHVIMKPKLERLRSKIDRILDNIITEHKENRSTKKIGEFEEDLVDVLLRVQESGTLEFPITTDNIKAVILDMFIGGSESSSIVVEWAMSEMMKNPTMMKKAQSEVRRTLKGKAKVEETDLCELNYLRAVIKETLRLHSPAPLLLPRECRENCELGGYEIPSKTRVIVNAWALSRDPEHWSEPDRFNPERFYGSPINFKGANLEYIPFGAGRRICPGISFGVATIELQLAKLLYHFDWMMPGGINAGELDMTEAFGLAMGRKNQLHLVAIPYIPL